MLSRQSSALPPSLTAYAIGFPCQPFSVQGQRRAFQDPRSKVISRMLDVIATCQPLYCVLENVVGFQKHFNTFLGLARKKKLLDKYFVFVLPIKPDKLLLAPVRRPRLYILFVRQDVAAAQSLQVLQCLVETVVDAIHASAIPTSLMDCLGPPSLESRTHGPLKRPLNRREISVAEELRQKFLKKNVTLPVVVDVSQAGGRAPHGIGIAPCLTRSSRLVSLDVARGTAHGITAVGKMLLHGVDVEKYETPAGADLDAFAGNMMHKVSVEVALLIANFLIDWDKTGQRPWVEMSTVKGRLMKPAVWKSLVPLRRSSSSVSSSRLKGRQRKVKLEGQRSRSSREPKSKPSLKRRAVETVTTRPSTDSRRVNPGRGLKACIGKRSRLAAKCG